MHLFNRLFGGLIFGEGGLIFGGAGYWKEFCVSKWVALDNKNSLKHKDNSLKQLKTANPNILKFRMAHNWKGICV